MKSFILISIYFGAVFAIDTSNDTKIANFETAQTSVIEQEYKVTNECPWTPANYTYPVYPLGTLGLHTEIDQFFEYMKPTRTEHELRKQVIAQLESAVLELWPNATVNLIGSTSTKLYLPFSDIDMKVFGVRDQQRFFMIKDKLSVANISEPNSFDIRNTSFGLIPKYIDSKSKIYVSITFDVDIPGDEDVRKTELIKDYIRQYPSLPKLMFVLKQFIAKHGLENESQGGISSNSVVTMCINFLQLNDKIKSHESENLGVLLIGFFEMYGRNFDYLNTGISIQNGGLRLSKEELKCEKIDKNGNPLLCIENPTDPNGNSGQYDTHRLLDVKRAFNDAYDLLSSAVSFNQNSGDKYKHKSILCQLIDVTKDVIEYRQWIRNTFEHTLTHTKV